jgi:Flp pilus assembly pilin Flp
MGGTMTLVNEALLRLLVRLHGLRVRPETERGQTLAEYALLMGVISVAVVVGGLVVLRSAIVEAWDALPHCFR